MTGALVVILLALAFRSVGLVEVLRWALLMALVMALGIALGAAALWSGSDAGPGRSGRRDDDHRTTLR